MAYIRLLRRPKSSTPVTHTGCSVLHSWYPSNRSLAMARNQKNFDNFLYVDDNAVDWTKRGESGGAATAVDGHATSTSAPKWTDSGRMKARRIIYKDLTTGRVINPIFYTAAAYAAVDLGDTLAVQVEGLATT